MDLETLEYLKYSANIMSDLSTTTRLYRLICESIRNFKPENLKPDDKLTIIEKEVKKYFNIDYDIMVKASIRQIVIYRQICHYFAKKYTKLSFKHIAYKMGKKDHATCLHSVKVVNNLMFSDKELNYNINEINKKLKTKFDESNRKNNNRNPDNDMDCCSNELFNTEFIAETQREN
jgi:chromosomal replication initiator protein